MSRHVLVTGAGTGIGEAISRQLHAEGYWVTLLGRRLEPLAVLAASLGEHSQDRNKHVQCPPLHQQVLQASFVTFRQSRT